MGGNERRAHSISRGCLAFAVSLRNDVCLVSPPPPQMADKTKYFTVLGLPKTCSDADILKAFRAYSLRWHPQRNRDPNAVERLAEVCEAYQVLSDVRYRSLYERNGEKGPRFEGFKPAAPDSVFQGFWGKYGGEGVVQKYLAKEGDCTAQPPDFKPTIDQLEGVHGFNKMFNGDKIPWIDPWAPPIPAEQPGLSGASIREQMMAQWKTKRDGGAPAGAAPPARAASGSGPSSARHNAQRRMHSASSAPPFGEPEDPPPGVDRAREEPRADTLAPDMQVLLFGLRSASHHNGKTGRVQGVAGERYTVLLDDGTTLNVRPANLMQMPRVTAVGAAEAPNCKGVVTNFDADTQLYEVQLVTGESASLRPGHVVLSQGACVMVVGLSGAAQYNGKWGKVLEVDWEASRYLLKLDAKTQIRVKWENARICTPALGDPSSARLD